MAVNWNIAVMQVKIIVIAKESIKQVSSIYPKFNYKVITSYINSAFWPKIGFHAAFKFMSQKRSVVA